MAELVDAPDSKSGHFGGVGSIPSTPTTLFNFKFQPVVFVCSFGYVLFIKISIKVAIENIMNPNMYILKVRPYFSADKPTSAGPKIIPVNDILVT